MAVYHVIQARAINCPCEVFINGLSVDWLHRLEGALDRPVDELVVRADNELSVVIGAELPPLSIFDEPKVITVSRPMSLTIDLWHDPSPRGNPAARERLAQLNFSAPAGARIQLPTVESRRFNAPRAPVEQWDWQKLPPLKLDDVTRASLLNWISEQAEQLQNGQTESLIAAAAPRFADFAAAYGHNVAQRQSLFRSSIAEKASKPHWQMEPLDAAASQLRLVAGNRLIECLDDRRQPLLRAAETPEGVRPAVFKLVVAPQVERWTVYR